MTRNNWKFETLIFIHARQISSQDILSLSLFIFCTILFFGSEKTNISSFLLKHSWNE